MYPLKAGSTFDIVNDFDPIDPSTWTRYPAAIAVKPDKSYYYGAPAYGEEYYEGGKDSYYGYDGEHYDYDALRGKVGGATEQLFELAHCWHVACVYAS